MTTGIALTFLIGIIWMLVGIIYSKATRDKNEFNLFMITYLIIYAILAFLLPQLFVFEGMQNIIPLKYMPVKPLSVVPLSEIARLLVLMAPVSIFGFFGFFLLSIAMRKGSHSVAWGIMQSAIILPFLAGWLIFRDNVNAINLSGMFLIVVALGFMVRGKQLNNHGSTADVVKNDNKVFLFWTFMAFLGTGISQIFSLLPNKVTVICPDSAAFSEAVLAWRIPLMSLCGLCIWTVMGLICKVKFSLSQVKSGFSYAVVVFAGQTLLYVAIDCLSEYNLSGIVYPIAVGCCVVFFALFCIIYKHEKLHYLEKIGLGILSLGIFAQAIASV